MPLITTSLSKKGKGQPSIIVHSRRLVNKMNLLTPHICCCMLDCALAIFQITVTCFHKTHALREVCYARTYFSMGKRVTYTLYYHTSNSCECMGVNEEVLQLARGFKKAIFLLQLMRESVSGTTSHMRCI